MYLVHFLHRKLQSINDYQRFFWGKIMHKVYFTFSFFGEALQLLAPSVLIRISSKNQSKALLITFWAKSDMILKSLDNKKSKLLEGIHY